MSRSNRSMEEEEEEEEDLRSVNLLLSSPEQDHQRHRHHDDRERNNDSDDDSITVDPTAADASPFQQQQQPPYDNEVEEPSPATQTLNALSQQSQDTSELLLMQHPPQPQRDHCASSSYDSMSQLECEAVQALVRTKQQQMGPRDFMDHNDETVSNLGATNRHPSAPRQQQPSNSFPSTVRIQPTKVASSTNSNKRKDKRKFAQPVQLVDVRTGRCLLTYASLSQAAASVGCTRHRIKNLLNSDESFRGWNFRRAADDVEQQENELEDDDEDDMGPPPSKKSRLNKTASTNKTTTTSTTAASNNKKNKQAAVPVEQIDLETGLCVRTYTSLTGASRGTGVKRRAITKIVKGESSGSSVSSKWTFRYAASTADDDADNVADNKDQQQQQQQPMMVAATAAAASSSQGCGGKGFKPGRRVQELDAATGTVLATFHSVTAAMVASGIKQGTMFRLLKGFLPEWNGKVYRYCDRENDRNADSKKNTKKKKRSPPPKAAPAKSNPAVLREVDDDDELSSTLLLLSKNGHRADGKSTTGDRVSALAAPDETTSSPPLNDNVNSTNSADGRESTARKKKKHHRETACGSPDETRSSSPHKEASSAVTRKVATAARGVGDDGSETTTEHRKRRQAPDNDQPATSSPPSHSRGALRHKPTTGSTAADTTTKKKPDPLTVSKKQSSSGGHGRPSYHEESAADSKSKPQDDPPPPPEDAPDNSSRHHQPGRSFRRASDASLMGNDNDTREATTSHTSTPHQEDGLFESLFITVDQQGSLGLRIVAAHPPPELVAFLFQEGGYCCGNNEQPWTTKNETPPPRMMTVSGLNDPTIGGKAGIREGDWLLLPNNDNSNNSQAAGESGTCIVVYEEIRSIIWGGKRPITFLVVRETKATRKAPSPAAATVPQQQQTQKKQEPSAIVSELKESTSTLTTAAATTTTQSSGKGPAIGPAPEESKAVPFCALCNGRQTTHPVHHSWCPENVQFVKSGADVILARLQRGVQLGCGVCAEEFKTGRALPGKKHSKACRQPQKQGSSKDKKTQKNDALASNRSKNTLGDDADDDSDDDSSQSTCLSHIGDDDNGSVFPSPSKTKSRTFRKLEVVKKKPAAPLKPSQASTTAQPARKGAASLTRASTAKPKKSTRRDNQQQQPKDAHKSSKAATSAQVLRDRDDANKNDSASRSKSPLLLAGDDETVEEEDPNETLNVTWEACEDFWGPEGHVDGDIVVFSTSSGLSHFDSVFPSERFEMDPFSPSARYRRTHVASEEGFHTIVLTRDFQAQRPWGFSCELHEFGGACLVSTVEPLSPAAAAVFMGTGSSSDSNKAPLRVNDLLVAVNGKSVGGMTETGLGIELDQSGPDLILVVSRYKFAAEIQNSTAQAEQSYLKEVDAAINDDRRLSWTDICGGNAEVETTASVTTNTETTSTEKERKLAERGQSLEGSSGIAENKKSKGESIAPCADDKDPNSPRSTARVGCQEREILGQLLLSLSPPPSNGGGGPEWSKVHDEGTEAKVRSGALEKLATSENASHSDLDQQSEIENDRIDGHQDSSDIDEELPQLDNASPLRFQRMENSVAESSDLENELFEAATEGLLDDDEDDGNAWCGCVCGAVHSEMVPVFWIQCDCCRSWYNVSGDCVGFSEAAAKYVKAWLCRGCANLDGKKKRRSPTALSDFPIPKKKLKHSCPSSDEETENHQASSSTPQHDQTLNVAAVDEETGDCKESETESAPIVPFAKNDLVFVQEHGWANVNNPEGVATVQKAYIDEDGDQVYDLKYVVGGRCRGVLHEYLRPHKFE